MLSDHKDSDSYSYSRTWEDFHAMLDKAEIKKNIHHQMKSEKIILDWLARYVDDVTTAEVDGEKITLRCGGEVVGLLVYQRLIKKGY